MSGAPTCSLNMKVSEEALAIFEQLRSRAGLSQSRMFARLMAEQAQRLRLEHDIEHLKRGGPDEEAASIATWQASHMPDLGE